MTKFFLILLLTLTMFSLPLFSRDPLAEIDGTESWYEGSMEGNGDIVYYNESYEKDMKIYLSYLKSKQKNKLETKSISYKVNKRSKSKDNYESKDDEIGEIGSIKEDDKLSNELLNNKKSDNDDDLSDDDLSDDDLSDDDLSDEDLD